MQYCAISILQRLLIIIYFAVACNDIFALTCNTDFGSALHWWKLLQYLVILIFLAVSCYDIFAVLCYININDFWSLMNALRFVPYSLYEWMIEYCSVLQRFCLQCPAFIIFLQYLAEDDDDLFKVSYNDNFILLFFRRYMEPI